MTEQEFLEAQVLDKRIKVLEDLSQQMTTYKEGYVSLTIDRNTSNNRFLAISDNKVIDKVFNAIDDIIKEELKNAKEEFKKL